MMAAWLAAALATGQYCPSYTASSPKNTKDCAIEAAPGTNPTTADWQALLLTTSLGPSAWMSGGPTVKPINRGCSRPLPKVAIPAHFPCELVSAMAWQESFWKQFCVPTTPSDQAGKPSQTIISFDCGYGVLQVTSGMHTSDPAQPFDRSRVASEPLYAAATGALIFADKWRSTPCVGDNLPEVPEHWYWAVTAYNGFGSINDPHKPGYSTTRGVWNPATSAQDAAPYQEKIFGRVEHPASARWPSVALAYPDLLEIDFSARGKLSEPACATPTNCTTSRPTHVTPCLPLPDGGIPDSGVPDAGTPDAGPTPPDGGAPDAGLDGGFEEQEPVEYERLETETLSPVPGGCQSTDAAALLPWAVGLWWWRTRRRGR